MTFWHRLLCWPCIICGAGFFLVSFASHAQTEGVPMDAVSYWREVAMGAIGLCLIMIGWYMRSLDALVRATADAMNKHYLTKNETAELIGDKIKPVEVKIDHVGEQIDRLTGRFDSMKFPSM